MDYTVQPIAFVKNPRKSPIDDDWEKIISEIHLADVIPSDALKNIEQFSHLEIIYIFDKVIDSEIKFSGHPRGNPEYPEMGIFAQRKKDRPNCIGLCTVELLQHTDRILHVKYLDAIDGTPILDIKPVFKEFGPKSRHKQPEWVTDLMKNYW